MDALVSLIGQLNQADPAVLITIVSVCAILGMGIIVWQICQAFGNREGK